MDPLLVWALIWIGVLAVFLAILVVITVAFVLWLRARRVRRQQPSPPYRPADSRAIDWDNTRRRELDADSTIRFSPVQEENRGDQAR